MAPSNTIEFSYTANNETVAQYTTNVSELTDPNLITACTFWTVMPYDTIMAIVAALPNLEFIRCEDNHLTKFELPYRPKIKHVQLSNNNIAEFDAGNTPNLTHLLLGYNPLRSLKSLAKLKDLKSLVLSCTKVSSLVNLPVSLEYLDVHKCHSLGYVDVSYLPKMTHVRGQAA